MKTPEGVTKADIKKLLDSYGDKLHYAMPVQAGYGKRMLDFYICFHGHFISVEAKRKGSKARIFQERLMESIRAAGGTAMCVDRIDYLKQVLDSYQFLANLEKSKKPQLANLRTQAC